MNDLSNVVSQGLTAINILRPDGGKTFEIVCFATIRQMYGCATTEIWPPFSSKVGGGDFEML